MAKSCGRVLGRTRSGKAVRGPVNGSNALARHNWRLFMAAHMKCQKGFTRKDHFDAQKIYAKYHTPAAHGLWAEHGAAAVGGKMSHQEKPDFFDRLVGAYKPRKRK